MIISIFNQKGGCGKSTTTINLGAALAKLGKKVLVVDMDAQANTTNGVGIDDEELEVTIYDLLISKKVTYEKIKEVIKKTPYENLECLPSDIQLSNAEIELASAMSRETILKKIIDKIKNDYDYILIDSPPSLGLLSVNSLVASDKLIIPVNTSYFSVKGIKHLMSTFNLVKDNLNEKLEIIGVLITMFSSRKTIAKNIRESLIEVFGDKVFDSVIRVDSKIEYSQDVQSPVIYFNNKCNAFNDYMSLSKEILNYEQK
ncbi:AAA family ATPase (plasmid) [Clostridium estertheticum]|uniref:Sporulation initiation inhibitor protein Soj n=1 Tax=Clostridium estertheticum TaxID=238834 RepID=A0AA47ERC3_9CLOT|nr:AAA family ATPase [Clostridium estertheticum]MBU3157704.1 AAA family ATPase [Clostridium estertheticum]MBU3201991.1 AAA family ATPase [Clostridium estertheticum]WAG63333.1 AAA family ATPase [Clostridium estertheticum]WAG68238.1 AAA family ATPase [Clostridium estertheticum]